MSRSVPMSFVRVLSMDEIWFSLWSDRTSSIQISVKQALWENHRKQKNVWLFHFCKFQVGRTKSKHSEDHRSQSRNKFGRHQFFCPWCFLWYSIRVHGRGFVVCHEILNLNRPRGLKLIICLIRRFFVHVYWYNYNDLILHVFLVNWNDKFLI